jgi:hypothetical protein
MINFKVILEKEQFIENHSHSGDALHVVTDGQVKVNNDKVYNKGDWYLVKKNTKYNVQPLMATNLSDFYICECVIVKGCGSGGSIN